jgi:type II secretory pathway component GspD/PulD (secretin)
MVFLRPKIIHSAEDARTALADVDTQAPQVRKWQDEVLPSSKPAKKSKNQ